MLNQSESLRAGLIALLRLPWAELEAIAKRCCKQIADSVPRLSEAPGSN